jgi:hypothetical protein
MVVIYVMSYVTVTKGVIGFEDPNVNNIEYNKFEFIPLAVGQWRIETCRLLNNDHIAQALIWS